jgi:hypothetical protein
MEGREKTNSIDRSPFYEAESRSASQNVPRAYETRRLTLVFKRALS